MHALSYLQKRGHLSAVALGRKMFATVADMTPARFDVLYAIHQYARWRDDFHWPGGPAIYKRMPQATLGKRLGLARQTIWKMVQRLVELGLLRKWKDHVDPRRVCLELMPEGLQRIRRAYGAAFSERYPVPRQPDGTEAPRHAYRLVRDAAKHEDDTAKMFLKYGGRVLPPHLRASFWPSEAPPKIGREVEKVFTALARKRARTPVQRKRLQSRGMLDRMIQDAHALAKLSGTRRT